MRVRLLLDDGGTTGLDDALQALHSHPNAEVRLVNPLPLRGWLKLLGYVTDFRRAQRRMHNKSFSADGQASIVGGRNVGNEYFGATDSVVFADLDVLAIGPAVLAIEQDFDRYWNHGAAYPGAPGSRRWCSRPQPGTTARRWRPPPSCSTCCRRNCPWTGPWPTW